MLKSISSNQSTTIKDLKFRTKFIANSLNIRKTKSEVVKRHTQLKALYKADPKKAMIVDSATVIGKNFHDPFRSEVEINDAIRIPLRTGLHSAVGGDNDFPNPGDILCAAIASCMEGTLKMIANRLEIELNHTKINVKAHVDTRGTLMFDKSVPVGFQYFDLKVEVGASNVSSKTLQTLFAAAKRSCVVYQTVKGGTCIKSDLKIVNVGH